MAELNGALDVLKNYASKKLARSFSFADRSDQMAEEKLDEGTIIRITLSIKKMRSWSSATRYSLNIFM